MSSKRKPSKITKRGAGWKDQVSKIVQSIAGKKTINIAKAYCRITFSLFFTDVIQSSLDPVYGHIPASRYHNSVTLAALLISCFTYSLWRRPSQVWTQIFIAVIIPSIANYQFFLFRFSGPLGPQWGPLLMNLIVTFPIVLISTVFASDTVAHENEMMPRANEKRADRTCHADLHPLVYAGISLAAYLTKNLVSNFIRQRFQTYVLRSRVTLGHILTFVHAILLGSGKLWLVAISISPSVLWTPYTPSIYTDKMLNLTLHKHGFSLVARQESLTGYISVLDNQRDGFRVMRCDHSLLGGEWIPPRGHVPKLQEPIYAIFVMLEAVRLVQPQPRPLQGQVDQQSALVIGLGIGTTPSALIAHGIDTTVVEIDPVVYEFANQHFRLPGNHTSVIDDAVAFVERNRRGKKYEYIVHDVFTGGAEPINLFTMEFLQGLRDMLKEEGVIAINYAGDLRLRSASMVVRTVLSVFRTCRLFREEAEPPEESKTDFTNLVLFCRKAAGSFKFRQPTRDDFLGSQARQHHLLPRYEMNKQYFTKRHGTDVVTKRNSAELEKSQYQSALGHWKVMRSVLPDAVWENW